MPSNSTRPKSGTGPRLKSSSNASNSLFSLSFMQQAYSHSARRCSSSAGLTRRRPRRCRRRLGCLCVPPVLPQNRDSGSARARASQPVCMRRHGSSSERQLIESTRVCDGSDAPTLIMGDQKDADLHCNDRRFRSLRICQIPGSRWLPASRSLPGRSLSRCKLGPACSGRRLCSWSKHPSATAD